MDNSYDIVAYPGHAFPNTHPDRLAAMALLYGLTPAPVERCRVLEIACSEGANLIPMAYAVPGSEFVGFDLAGQPIERGIERIRELGLKNIRLFQADLLNVGEELGHFDYIIAHGLYAWVPEPIRNRLMEAISQLLTPNGIAFISYNALPGSHLRRIVRDAMLFRGDGIADPDGKVAAGIQFLEYIHQSRGVTDVYDKLIVDQLEFLRDRDRHVTFHDELSEAYHPVSFLDFAQHARAHGLDYLAETTFAPPADLCHRPNIRAAVQQAVGDDFLRQEQMFDFLRARIYRETLLCRAGLNPAREISAANLCRLCFASVATSVESETPGAVDFLIPSGMRIEMKDPRAIAFLRVLEEAWPGALTLDEIARRAGSAFQLDDEGVLLLTRLAIARMVDFRAWNSPAACHVSDRPRASLCARLEARRYSRNARPEPEPAAMQNTVPRASTLLNTSAMLDDPMQCALLDLLDGTRDRAALLDGLRDALPELPPEELEAKLDAGLKFFLRVALLEA